MLKVLEWLIGGVVIMATWIAILLNIRSSDLSSWERILLLYFPIWAVLSFGVVSLGIIAYRTTTLRDCPEAAKEVQQQIAEAKADLKKRGFKF